jgi:hypothetical protein
MYIHPPEILVLGFGREEPSHLGMEKISARFARRNMKAVATIDKKSWLSLSGARGFSLLTL